MRWIKRIFFVLIATIVSYVLLTLLASELGGEVVTLLRPNVDGSFSETRVWIVDSGAFEMIEHGEPGAGWLKGLTASTHLDIQHEEQVIRYTGTVAADQHGLYHQLRREKYGFADQVIEWLSMTPAKDCSGAPVVLKRLQ